MGFQQKLQEQPKSEHNVFNGIIEEIKRIVDKILELKYSRPFKEYKKYKRKYLLDIFYCLEDITNALLTINSNINETESFNFIIEQLKEPLETIFNNHYYDCYHAILNEFIRKSKEINVKEGMGQIIEEIGIYFSFDYNYILDGESEDKESISHVINDIKHKECPKKLVEYLARLYCLDNYNDDYYYSKFEAMNENYEYDCDEDNIKCDYHFEYLKQIFDCLFTIVDCMDNVDDTTCEGRMIVEKVIGTIFLHQYDKSISIFSDYMSSWENGDLKFGDDVILTIENIICNVTGIYFRDPNGTKSAQK